MDSAVLQEFAMIFALILLNGFFAGAEIAILTARRSRIEPLADQGDRGAQLALALANDADQFLPTVQVGITLVGTFAAVYGGASLAERLDVVLAGSSIESLREHSRAISQTLVAVLIAFLSLVFGELTPKRLALLNAEPLARIVSWPMTILQRLARPAVWFLRLVTSIVLTLLGQNTTRKTSVALEDIQHLIDAGTDAGILEESEQRVAAGALKLGESTVKSIMRPRIDIDAMDIDTPADEVVGAIAMSGFSRIPVCEKDVDHIVGFVYIKDVFLQQYLDRPIDVRRLLRPALFVPTSVTIARLLELFGEQKTQLAIVLDEYGGTEGMVTLEDVLEMLIGEIHDEHRHGRQSQSDRDQLLVKRSDGTWLVDATTSLHDLEIALEISRWTDPPPRGVGTISGVVLALLRRPPKITDVITWNNLRIEIVDMDGPRIDRLLVHVVGGASDSKEHPTP